MNIFIALLFLLTNNNLTGLTQAVNLLGIGSLKQILDLSCGFSDFDAHLLVEDLNRISEVK